MTTSRLSCVAVAIALSSAADLSEAADAVILFSDTFTRIEGSGDPNLTPADPDNFSAWGTNDNGLGGTNTFEWVTGPNRPGGANAVTDGDLASTIEGIAYAPFDIAANAPGGFSVALDFNRFHPSFEAGGGNGFMTIGLGRDNPAEEGFGSFSNVSLTDFTFLFQQGVGTNQGNTQIFEDGVMVTTDPGPVDYGDPTIEHSVLLTVTPQSLNAYGETDTIDMSIVVDGGSPFNFTTLGGSNFGQLSLSSNGFVHRSWDNIVVTALAFEEPDDLAGDYSNDGVVDAIDYAVWREALGTSATLPNDDTPGVVDSDDFNVWLSQYGASAPGTAFGAPEPASGLLLTLAILGLTPRRRMGQQAA